MTERLPSWDSRDFRREREQLGRLGAEYLNLVRKNESLAQSTIESLWAWDEQRQAIEARPEARTEGIV